MLDHRLQRGWSPQSPTAVQTSVPMRQILHPLPKAAKVRKGGILVIAQAKLTQKHQITIPAEARRRLGLAAGDTVYLALENGQVVLRGLHRGWAESHHGIGADLWKEDGGGQQFIEQERDAWDEG